MTGEAQAAGFTVVEHTADIGFTAWGPSAAEVFRQSVHALAEIAFEIGSMGDACHEHPVGVEGTDWADVLVNFLNEVLYLFDAERFATADCVVEHASPTSVSATLRGEPRDAAKHPWKLIVKAVTYHDLAVEARDGRWHARVILDV